MLLQHPLQPAGFLDSEGQAHVEIKVSRLLGRGFWVGRTIHHAYIVLD